jgi:hypothetical protein
MFHFQKNVFDFSSTMIFRHCEGVSLKQSRPAADLATQKNIRYFFLTSKKKQKLAPRRKKSKITRLTFEIDASHFWNQKVSISYHF